MGPEYFAVPLAISILVFGFSALLVHALTCVFLRVSAVKRFSASQVLTALVTLAAGSAASIARAVVRVLGSLLRWWLLFGLAFMALSIINVTYNEYQSVWLGAVSYYNAWMGPFVHRTLVVPLQIADLLLRGLLPIWNAAFWFSKALGVQGLLPILIQEIETVLQMAQALVTALTALATSLFDFVGAFDCVGAVCLQPDAWVFDLLTTLASLREFCALGVELVRAVCGTLAAPLDIVVYPLLDLNLAEALHSLANAVLQLFLVIPRVTAERCALAAADTTPFKTMLCIPDMTPVFTQLVAGLGSTGLALDNWVNVAFLIVQKAVTGSAPGCDVAGGGTIPDLISNWFPGTETAVLGLTDFLYAVTDGVTAVYMGHSDPDFKTQSWPYAMDPSLGFAAVTYSSVHDLDVSALSDGATTGALQTTDILGCNCSDVAAGVEILCAILPMSGIPSGAAQSEYLLQVLFPDPITPTTFGGCAGIDVYVKSVRWPFTRYESQTATLGSTGASTALPSTDCISRGTCREVDATVWVVPRCLDAPGACIPTAQCMPFCMAARASGSGRDNLVLAGARRWRGGLTLLDQDCAVASSSPATTQPVMGQSGTVSIAASDPGDFLGSGLPSGVFASPAQSQVCAPAKRISSVVDKPKAAAQNVAATGQPFVIIGDTILTSNALGGGAVSVAVERLSGDQFNVFSLTTMNQNLPAEPLEPVPEEEAAYSGGQQVLLPYAYGTERMAATGSRNYLFYASNPALGDAFSAYFEYCAKSPNQLGKLGLLELTTDSPIRIYRVSAYRRCGASSCGPGLVAMTTIAGFTPTFNRNCSARFNVSVEALEYLNEDNIIVLLKASRPQDWHAANQSWAGAGTGTTVYWLNPATMQLRETIWQTALPSTSYGVLCPSQQRLPRVGSFAAEVVNSGVFLVQTGLFAVLYTPGMVPVWSAGGSCPATSGTAYYHSVLANCAADLYGLDDFFDSLDDAVALFWHSLSLIGQLAGPGAEPTPVADVLEGMEQYGRATIDLWAARANVMTLMKLPVKDQLEEMWGAMQTGGARIQAAAYMGRDLSAWCRFSYKAVSGLTLELVKEFLSGSAPTAAQAWLEAWGVLNDLKDDFTATVTARNRLGCGGLKLMFGLGNPWSDLIYYHCAASSELMDDLYGLALTLFVQIPMAKCICKDSAGRGPITQAVQVCSARIPASLLPTLYMITNQLVGSYSYGGLACSEVVGTVQGNINGTMDSWFENQYSALDALASSVDYVLEPLDASSGQCLDFQHDPHVVVIVPDPVDYFQGCARTSVCKKLCAAEWALFQAALAPPVQLPSMSVETQSLFFPGQLDPALTLSNVSCSVQIPPDGICNTRPIGQLPDFAIAVAEISAQSLQVQYWCAPQMASSSVYQVHDLYGLPSVTLPGDVLASTFGPNATWLALMLQVGGAQGVYWLNHLGLQQAPDCSSLILPQTYFVKFGDIWTIEGALLVDVVTRTFQGSGALVNSQHIFIVPNSNQTDWLPTSVDLTGFGAGQYWYSRLSDGTTLIMPKLGAMPLYRAQFALGSGVLTQVSMTSLSPSDLSAMQGLLVSPVSLSTAYIFATASSGWDWLRRVQLGDGYVEGVFNSAPITMRIVTNGNCNELSCEGCASVQLQRLCLAYNKCSLINCVGTPVHQTRPLCGVGQLLQQTGSMSLRSSNAAWTVFSETLCLTMELSLRSLRSATLLWPEDSFLCYVCQAKDSRCVARACPACSSTTRWPRCQPIGRGG